MYTDRHLRRMERQMNHEDLDNIAVDNDTPAKIAERADEPTPFERVLMAACTNDERALANMLETLLDKSWELATGKAMRGELRSMFLETGRSKRRYYAAFNALRERTADYAW